MLGSTCRWESFVVRLHAVKSKEELQQKDAHIRVRPPQVCHGTVDHRQDCILHWSALPACILHWVKGSTHVRPETCEYHDYHDALRCRFLSSPTEVTANTFFSIVLICSVHSSVEWTADRQGCSGFAAIPDDTDMTLLSFIYDVFFRLFESHSQRCLSWGPGQAS